MCCKGSIDRVKKQILFGVVPWQATQCSGPELHFYTPYKVLESHGKHTTKGRGKPEMFYMYPLLTVEPQLLLTFQFFNTHTLRAYIICIHVLLDTGQNLHVMNSCAECDACSCRKTHVGIERYGTAATGAPTG